MYHNVHDPQDYAECKVCREWCYIPATVESTVDPMVYLCSIGCKDAWEAQLPVCYCCGKRGYCEWACQTNRNADFCSEGCSVEFDRMNIGERLFMMCEDAC